LCAKGKWIRVDQKDARLCNRQQVARLANKKP
jgi:hypothetical protein